MNKILISLSILGLWIAGCSFDVQVMTPVGGTETATPGTPIIPSPSLTLPPATEAPLPGFTPTTSAPVFFGAFVTLNQVVRTPQYRFPAGTEQIFAAWNYQNMRADLTVKREWYLNGQRWLEREALWDFAKYGERGMVPDVSIFDFEAGLPSGVYQLMIYIDGVRQPIGKTTEGEADEFIEFEILPPIEAKSPNGGWIVRADRERLILFDTGGGQADIFTGREIAAVGWFPDSRHLLVVDRDRSQQIPGVTVGIRDDLWLVDMDLLETRLLYESDAMLGVNVGLAVSPDGRYVAASEGSGFGDACFVDVRMTFFEVAADFKSVKVIEQKSFAGIPSAADSFVYPAQEGGWRAGNQYAVTLKGTCAIDQSLMGVYVFDVNELTATKR